MYGLILTPYFGWILGTLLGAVAGSVLPSIMIAALGVAIYGMFIAIVLPAARSHLPTALCILLAIALSCMFYYVPVLNTVPTGFVIIICAVTASAVFAFLRPIGAPVKKEDEA